MNQELLSTSEIAKILGMNRVAIFKKIKSDRLKAEKIGRNYVVKNKDLMELLGKTISEEKKKISIKRQIKP
jgi:excisionase family DNA binding protein